MRENVSVREIDRECVCVCLRKRERMWLPVCVREGIFWSERQRVCVCVWMCVRERVTEKDNVCVSGM